MEELIDWRLNGVRLGDSVRASRELTCQRLQFNYGGPLILIISKWSSVFKPRIDCFFNKKIGHFSQLSIHESDSEDGSQTQSLRFTIQCSLSK